MKEEKIDKLVDCLFVLVSSLNTVLDRLDTLTDRHEELIKENGGVFSKMREEFWRKVIETEVNKEIKKNERSKR